MTLIDNSCLQTSRRNNNQDREDINLFDELHTSDDAMYPECTIVIDKLTHIHINSLLKDIKTNLKDSILPKETQTTECRVKEELEGKVKSKTNGLDITSLKRVTNDINETVVSKKPKKKLYSKSKQQRLSLDAVEDIQKASHDVSNAGNIKRDDISVRKYSGMRTLQNSIYARNIKGVESGTDSDIDYRVPSSSGEDSCAEDITKLSTPVGYVSFRCDDEISFNLPSTHVGLIKRRKYKSDTFVMKKQEKQKKRLLSKHRKRFSMAAKVEEQAPPLKISTNNEDILAATTFIQTTDVI